MNEAKRCVAMTCLYRSSANTFPMSRTTHFSLSYSQHIRSERNTYTDFTKPVQKLTNCSAPTDEQQDCELLNWHCH
jgi:hypothetical protein